jgi:alkanesulfonate monooxygenase SsuD/methylene tetrahydromethanopterin reductase-like flavin-dependent oxidoreductase (luciferase family)
MYVEGQVKLGLFVMPMHPPGKPHADCYDQDLATLREADELGYDEAWIGEHFTSTWENIPAPDLMIAAALRETRRIRLGTGVSCLPNHHPAVLAHRIAQLDQMARGRFNFGIGTGGFPGDFTLFGVDNRAGEQYGLTRQVIDAVLKMWSDNPEPFAAESAWWRFQVPEAEPSRGIGLHMKPYQRPHPPIAVAGFSPHSPTLTLAGERGWIPMSINFSPTPTLKTHWEAVELGARRSGIPADRGQWRVCRDIHVAETTKQARREALAGAQAQVYTRYFFPLTSSVGQLGHFKVDPAESDDVVSPEYLLDHTWIVGDPQTCAEKIRALYQELGGFGGLVALVYDWGHEEPLARRSRELLAREVLPRLRDLDGAV